MSSIAGQVEIVHPVLVAQVLKAMLVVQGSEKGRAHDDLEILALLGEVPLGVHPMTPLRVLEATLTELKPVPRRSKSLEGLAVVGPVRGCPGTGKLSAKRTAPTHRPRPPGHSWRSWRL